MVATFEETQSRNCAAAQIGYGEFQVTHARGERADCFRQYLAPVLGRPNLTVLTAAKTLRVETEAAGAGAPVSRGVTFQIDGPDGSVHSGVWPSSSTLSIMPCQGSQHLPVCGCLSPHLAVQGATNKGCMHACMRLPTCRAPLPGRQDGLHSQLRQGCMHACAAELAQGGEVVMCAGSIHTPQVLQLSGIGPERALREAGLPVVADLPGVGQNMQACKGVLLPLRSFLIRCMLGAPDQACSDPRQRALSS
jgi:hypothetical protein